MKTLFSKIEALADLHPRLQWHLIGPLQSNKTRPVAEAFDWVHSVDRLKIAQRLAEVPAVAQAVAALPRERLVPRELMAGLNAAGLSLDTLSMGMSADLKAAVAEGATMVRVGSAIFGARG